MICCVLGFSLDFLKQNLFFLEKDKNNRVVFIDYKIPEKCEVVHSNIHFFAISSLFDISLVSSKIASIALFLEIEIVDLKNDPTLQQVASKILSIHQSLCVEFSDVLDFGAQKYKNALENLQKPYQRFYHLRNAFKDVPAIIVGAGPSLELIINDLEKYCDKALIIAGGKALEKIPFEPHFGVIIDPNEPLSNVSHTNTTICFQSRVNNHNLANFSSYRLQIPDSHLSFLNELTGDEQLALCGPTCGTVAVYLSLVLGCNPIITCGMDFCFLDDKKYAMDEKKQHKGNAWALNKKQQRVMTQKDWILAVQWMQQVEALYPNRQFFNISEEGLSFFSEANLSDFSFLNQDNFYQKIQKLLQKIPYESNNQILKWQKMIQLTQVENLNTLEESNIVQLQLLDPLWRLWQPIFEREFMKSTCNENEEMEKHKLAFFDLVLKAHKEVRYEL